MGIVERGQRRLSECLNKGIDKGLVSVQRPLFPTQVEGVPRALLDPGPKFWSPRLADYCVHSRQAQDKVRRRTERQPGQASRQDRKSHSTRGRWG